MNWGIDTQKNLEIILSVQKVQVGAYFKNKSQRYQFTCFIQTKEIQKITNPKNTFLKAKYQRSVAAFDIKIHGLTTSVPVLILPVFRQFLLRNGNISSKSLFWRRVDGRWQQKSFHKHFNWDYISTQLPSVIKYYLATNRGNLLQMQYGFYRHAM